MLLKNKTISKKNQNQNKENKNRLTGENGIGKYNQCDNFAW